MNMVVDKFTYFLLGLAAGELLVLAVLSFFSEYNDKHDEHNDGVDDNA